MKKINDLKAEESELITRMEKLLENPTDSNRRDYYELERERFKIEKEIKSLEEQEQRNKNNFNYMDITSTRHSFRDWLNKTITGEATANYKIELRADPLLTTSNTDIINKTVENLSVMYSPTEEMLKNLGIKFYTKVNGNLILPSMTQDKATWSGEDVSALSADMSTSSLTLSAKRVTHTQSISREAISQTTSVVDTIVENLYKGIWLAVCDKVFDNIDSDAASQIKNIKGATLSFEDVVLMEASLGAYTLDRPSYVMSPETKAFCKKTAALTNQKAIWEQDVVNEYKAFATPSVNGEKIYFGDWSKVVIAEFGDGITVIVDPFKDATKGLIHFTAIGLFDVGVWNNKAFCIINDASTF